MRTGVIVKLAFGALLPVVQCAGPANVTGMGTPVTKTTTNGDVIGRVDANGVERYFGIPTAADTSGANRFKAPQPLTSWTTAIETTMEKQCLREGTGVEDCLSVDVMTTTGASGLPVFCYIHGGGFTTQDPGAYRVVNAYYTKGGVSGLPNNGAAVQVFFHYRLGGLGFMAHPGLSQETGYGGSGNWGLMDSINNLQWVQSNIATFGGNTARVTIVGESAGGAHTLMLVASPLMANLYYAAIAESPFISYKPATFSIQARYAMASMWTKQAGCGEVGISAGTTATAEVACMRAAAASTFVGASPTGDAVTTFDTLYGSGASTLVLYNSINSWPVVDGYVLTHAPLAAWAAGVSADKFIIAGHNADEYTLFYSDSTGDYSGMPYSMADRAWYMGIDGLAVTSSFETILSTVMTTLSSATFAAIDGYYTDVINTYDKYVQMGTDAWFTGGIRLVLDALTAQPTRTVGTVYTFLYAQETAASVASFLPYFGAYHGMELTYVLGWYEEQKSYLTYDMPYPTTYTPAEYAVGTAMKTYWLGLMYSGDPNAAGSTTLPMWNPVTTSASNTMVFKATFAGGAALNPCFNGLACRTETTANYREMRKGFWNVLSTMPSDTMCYSGTSGLTKNFMSYSCPDVTAPVPPSPPVASDSHLEAVGKETDNTGLGVGLGLGLGLPAVITIALAVMYFNKKGGAGAVNARDVEVATASAGSASWT